MVWSIWNLGRWYSRLDKSMVVGENFDEVVQLLLVVILLERDGGERERGGGEGDRRAKNQEA